ncbi:MAG: lactate racemase domain-containing protein [Dehalococcoidales bacterium]|nr:lactate racemase domain-containing protein [Dehalococcoidales bacterium]
MQQVTLEYGDHHMTVELPDSATVVQPGVTYQDPPKVDPVEATRKALNNPLGMPPIWQLVNSKSKVVVAFPDRVKGGFHDQSHRKTAIPMILEDLRKGGVKEENITLMCAPGLHRKNTREELEMYLPKHIVDEFWGDRLVFHDAEDPDGVLDLEVDKHGDRVFVNKRVAEADLTIILGHAQGNPYGGYSGGYKMLVTGLTHWRSIRCHHTPATMYRDDFTPTTTHQYMRDQFDTIGKAIEERIGKKIFCVDAVVDTTAQVLGVYAGAIEEVQKASWPLADKRTNVSLPIEKADVLVFGMPRSFHYGPGMGTNPILMLQATGATLCRVMGALREGAVVIAPSVCDGWFNDEWFPAYREIYQRFQEKAATPADMLPFEEEFATRPDFIEKFRFNHAYHPFHAFSMLYMGGLAWQKTSALFMPGAENPGIARSMGFIPTKTFDEALKEAERYVGQNPRILALPEYLVRVPAHLFAEK